MLPEKMMSMQKLQQLKYLLIALIVILALCVLGYAIYQLTLKNRNNKRSEEQLEIENNIQGFDAINGKYQYKLRDYYVMSSYNSCCGGGFNNNFIDYEPLKNVIKRGARVLDFEIYSWKTNTVVSASDNGDFMKKGTYNSLPFAEVMKKVNMYAFSGSTCPNPTDPLFLHFRIKSTQQHVYDDMTHSLYQTFLNRKLGSEYAFEYEGENLGLVPLKELQGKVIIICSRTNNDMFKNTKLDEFVNIASGGHFMRELRNYNVQYTHNHNELIDANKKNMAITMPDLTSSSKNMDASLHHTYGCQMACMNFQNLDSNLQYYIQYFNDNHGAFALKPEPLRYTTKMMKVPTKQDPKLSYARKNIKKPYFNHQI